MQYLGLYSRVLGLLKTEQKLAALLLVGTFFLGFFQLAQVALFGWFVQALVDNNSPSSVLVVWVSAALIFVGVALWVAAQASRIGHRVRLAAITHFFERNIAASAGLTSPKTQLPRINDLMLRGADQMFFLIISFFREHLPALTVLVLSLPLAFFASWQLALVLYGALACCAAASVFITRRAFAGQEQIEAFHARLRSRIADSMGKSMIVQSYGRLGAETEDLTRFMQDLLSAEYPVLNWWTRRHVLSMASGALLLAVVAAVAMPLYTSNSASIGDVVIFAGLSVVLTSCLWRVANAANILFFQSKPIADFFALIDAQAALNDNSEAQDLDARTGQITFNNVSYSAPGMPGLSNFNLTVMPGERIAFISDDATDSAIAAVLMRFAETQSGDVSIDNQNVRDVKLGSLRSNIAYVSRQPGLFKRSVMENLRVGAPKARQDELIDAVKKAGAHDFIAAKQEGFHTIVDDSFSLHEQRQIALARALVKKAPVVIYEQGDATADAAQSLDHLFDNRTTLIFSKDAAVLQKAHRIAVLKNGMIERIGSYDEIMLNTKPAATKSKKS